MRNDVLEYIGLDLENIPKKLLQKSQIHLNSYTGSNTYKVYDYISVHDLEILITPLDRTAELKDRYKLSKPLYEYLTTDDRKIKEIFVNVLESASVYEIKKLETLQEKLNKKIPDLVKYDKNYLWQIYYSEEEKKYFMLFPANEGETSVLFYIIKKKLEKEDTKIFVPISRLDYSESILSLEEINDIENYIWLFTNEWPNIYEVCKNELYITGKTKINNIFDSYYRNIYKSKEKAKEFYMLLKALFILTTETNYRYTFKPYVNNLGELELKYENININASNLSDFVDNQTERKKSNIKRLQEEIIEKEKILNELKEYIKKQNEIYLMQEKQIAMFLQCKKSFFKKISYFFKSKKFVIPKINEKVEKEEIKENDIEIHVSGSYTIKELINISEEESKVNIKVRNLRADIKQMQLKKENLARKIKNASEYIKEIEKHKKSIFEFWRFSNKDELPALEEGNVEEEKTEKILGSFNLEQDFEILGSKVDLIQRKELSKNELDIIYASQFCLDAINNLEDDKIIDKTLIKLKEKITKKENELEDLLKDYTKINTLKNKEHREVKRDEIKILNISQNTTKEEFKETMKLCKKVLENAYKKTTSIAQMPIYIEIKEDKKIKNGKYIIGNINPSKVIEEIEKDTDKKDSREINLYKIELNAKRNVIYYSNIIYFENQNNTLPIGMDLSTKVLVKIEDNDIEKNSKSKCKEEKKMVEEINLLEKIDNFNYRIKTIKIK